MAVLDTSFDKLAQADIIAVRKRLNSLTCS